MFGYAQWAAVDAPAHRTHTFEWTSDTNDSFGQFEPTVRSNLFSNSPLDFDKSMKWKMIGITDTGRLPAVSCLQNQAKSPWSNVRMLVVGGGRVL